MKIIVQKGTYAGGKRYDPSSKAVEVNEKDGRFLIAIGKAIIADDAPKKTVEHKEKDLDIKKK